MTDPLVQNNLSYNSPTYEVVNQQTARVDHEFNENNRAFVRFTRVSNPANLSSDNAPQNLAADGLPSGAALGYANNTSLSYTAATDYTHIFSPSFFAETVFSMQWFTAHHISGNDSTTNYESMLSLPNNFGEVGFPAITGLIEPLTSSQGGNLANIQIDTLLDENLTKTIGRHQILFGGRFSHYRNAVKPNGLSDSATFGGLATGIYQPTSTTKYTAVANSGYADADMFLGSAANYHVVLEPQYFHTHLNEADAYIQDNFHLSEKLTLNFGLRYEAHPALWTKDGLANSFDLKNDTMVLASPISELIAKGYTTQAIITNDENIGVKFETAQDAGFPANTLMYNYDLNFLPRFGVAWIPFHTGTIFRGGFGQYMYATPLSDFSLNTALNNPFTAQYNQSYALASQAIDNLPNEQLRYNAPVKFGVMGTTTSANAVNTNATNSILPGSSALYSASPNWKPVEVSQANVTIEQPLPGHSALRVSYLYSHSANLDMQDRYNNHPSNYQYEMAYGHVLPTGGASAIGTPLYAATAAGPYDQTTWGANTLETKNGWADYNALQINYQRLYHRGVAYQISYVYGKSMHVGGDVANTPAVAAAQNTSVVQAYPDANFPGVLGTVSQMSLLPGSSTPFAGNPPPPRPANLPVWADYHDMDMYQLYQLDGRIPKMVIKFNGILDLPVGRGKRFLSNSPRWLNEIVGGFQIAGSGHVISQVFNPDSSMWGPVSQIHVYKHKVPITDCRGGACVPSYLWFNGYLSPKVIGANCAAAPLCVLGVPSDYQPYQTPVDNDPTQTASFNTNMVNITFPGSTTPSTIAYDAGPAGSNYTSRTYLNGPVNWEADLSLFKVFPIKGGTNLRVNLDAFNAFNHQGETNPGTKDGVANFLTSYNTSRQLQVTARFTF